MTPAQYIVEQLCIKIAHNEGKDLPEKFWSLPEWAKIFRRHIRDVHKLLEKYHAKAIILTMRDKRMAKMFSFNFPPFKKVVEEYQKKVEAEQSQPIQTTEKPESNETQRPSYGKKSILAKLKENERRTSE